MNNKGFTLVELLAVIVLIAVLSVVAVSTYRGINESSKKRTLEAKIQQITSAAEKWARENNITTKTTISVNTLVVEGYITADSVGTDGLAVIKNPVTDENMICNVVEITFKDGIMKSLFNSSVQNCKLASQSLVDSNINILVKTRTNKDLTGSGSIAKWTNEDIEIIVNSTKYDTNAISISYDIEGSTITKNKDSLSKYTGTSFVNNPDDYYNVYFIKAELLLNTKIVVTYDIPGEGTKSRAYTIRFDKEEATVTLKSNNEWITTLSEVQVIVDDGKGSGPAAVYVGRDTDRAHATKTSATPKANITDLQVGKYYLWTEDNAGNISSTYKMILEVNNQDAFEPTCRVLFDGTEGDHGWYKKDPVTPIAENIDAAGVSGVNLGVNTTEGTPVYSGYAAYNTISQGRGTTREDNTPKTGTPYYCHARTLAGNYGTGTETLFLDRTKPTITSAVTGPTEHSQTKTLTVTLQDGLSGLNSSTNIKYGYSQDAGTEPTSWHTLTVNATAGTNTAASASAAIGSELTGTWYVWINIEGYKDYAGNEASFDDSGDKIELVSNRPFKFDNTAPLCNGNNGKTYWTNRTYTINEYCRDDYGTTDQSGCSLPFFTKIYNTSQNVRSSSLTIRDKAGNTTVCPHDVYLEHIKPSCELHEPEGGPDGENGWYKSTSVTILGTFQDNGDTSLQSHVAVFGTAKLPNSIAGATAVQFSENGANLTAWCYVRDNAGNEGANSLTFKKDDATEAINSGCSKILGNTTWTNTSPILIGKKVNTVPVSGCEPYSDDMHSGTWDENCNYHWERHVTVDNAEKTYTDIAVGFRTKSGINITCPAGFVHNVYVDRIKPTITTSAVTNNGKTSGVSFTVSCSDSDSGCVSSGDNHGSFSKIKSSGTYTVKDNAGNVASKTLTITTSDCNCDDCYTGSPSACVGGYVDKTKTYTTMTGCSRNCTGSCSTENNPNGTNQVTCKYSAWDSCASTTNTCKYGCDTCYSGAFS